jgi:hypothetical protein
MPLCCQLLLSVILPITIYDFMQVSGCFNLKIYIFIIIKFIQQNKLYCIYMGLILLVTLPGLIGK